MKLWGWFVVLRVLFGSGPIFMLVYSTFEVSDVLLDCDPLFNKPTKRRFLFAGWRGRACCGLLHEPPSHPDTLPGRALGTH